MTPEMYNAILTKRKDNSLNEYKENALLTKNIIEEISQEHSLEVKKIHKNIYLNYNGKTVEFDVLIEAETPTGRKRWISVELKDNDVSKVINQAVVRRDFVDYSYIILNNNVKWIVQYLFYVWSETIKEYQIGFFSNWDNKEIFILNSKFISSKINIKLEEEEAQ